MLPHQGLNKIIRQCYSVWFGFLLVVQNSAQQVKETVLYCDQLQKFNVSEWCKWGVVQISNTFLNSTLQMFNKKFKNI